MDTEKKIEGYKLNLGCGEHILEGYINIDLYNSDKKVMKHDLNKFPYPFPPESCSEIIITNTLPHLENPYKVMEEIDRILMKGGKLIVDIPTLHSGICQRRSFHSKDYFFTMYSKKSTNTGYYKFNYKLLSLKKVRRHGIYLFFSIKDRIRDFWNCIFYRKYIVVMEKK
jgi:SAM-dependent methyltransferase